MQFSVIIPTHNRAATLRRVLAAYEAQEPRELDFEVVVVDDGSTDGTAELLASWRPDRYRLRFAVEPNRGPAAARNRALKLAAGALVLFTGDDVEPAPDLLHQHLAGHRERADPAAAILGLTRWGEGAETTATMRHVDGPGAQQFSYHYMADGSEYDFRHLYTSNVSLARSLLDREPSYFSTDFPAAAFEDAELGYRLSKHGLKIFYRAAAQAFHHHRYDAPGFFRRQRRCGEMAALLYRKFPELRHILDFEILAEERLAMLVEPLPEAIEPGGCLSERERRTLTLAGFFDALPFEAADDLLLPLFRYAYLTGLAGALYRRPTAERLSSRLFAQLLDPALARFEARLRREGLPYPRADLEALRPATSNGGRRPAG